MELPFLNPWLLTGGVAVLGPVLIHLLNRQKVRTVEWGAMMLLRRVVKVRSRQVRLEDILLMLLRCLIIALIVLAAARPVTKTAAIVKSPDVAVMVAIDASMSMKHTPGVKSRFDIARDRAQEIFQTVEPGTPVSLVLLGQQSRVLFNAVGYDSASLQQALADAQAVCEPLNLERCLPELEALLPELTAPSREVYLITDAQESTWSGLSAPAKQSLSKLQSAARTLLLPIPVTGERNVAVTRLEVASGLPRVGSLVRYEAEVANLSPDQQDAGEVTLELNGEAIDRRIVGPLKSGERVTVPIYATFQRDGITRVTARLASDPLADDDTRHVVVNVRRAVRVLCVNGESSSPGTFSGAGLVATAMAPGTSSRASSPVEVDSISWLAMPGAKVADYDVVALVDVPEISEQTASDLKSFVAGGGGVIVFPGSGTRLAVWNERLVRCNSPLLPAELLPSDPLTDPRRKGIAIDWEPSNHPILKPLRSLPGDLLAEARVARILGAKPQPHSHVLLSTAAGQPLLLEQPTGRGRVLLFAISADRAWSNLAVNPAFPLMMQHAVMYLVTQPYERPVELPAPLVLPIVAESVTIAGADGATVPATKQTDAGQSTLSATLSRPGFYSVTAGESSLTVAANAPSVESDVTVLSPDQLRSAVDGTSVDVVDPSESIAAAAAVSRRGHELAPLLLVIAVCLFATEGLLARWFTGRGRRAV